MKLVLSQYLRTLKERDEFDRLLPELLFEMGYVTLSKPQTGVRQFGVDFAAIGKSAEDDVNEILLFVLKQGDIGRTDWSGSQNAVRESIIEILDVYLETHIPPQYKDYRKIVIVSTTGDLKQDTQLTWTTFVAQHTNRATFKFWSGDRVAELLERHLLDEHLFDAEDRSDLRKSLALAADSDYRFPDFCRLLLRQLGLTNTGALSESGLQQITKTLKKALSRIHLAASICTYWADAEGERCQALWVCERTILWAWHRLQLHPAAEQQYLYESLGAIWNSYQKAASRYYEAVFDHVTTRDGLTGYCRESAEYSVVLFEHIGLLASVGLTQALLRSPDDSPQALNKSALVVANALNALIANHDASGSPRLDRNAIDISLALLLLVLTNQFQSAENWLENMAVRLDFTYRIGRLFPVGSDSLDDLVELDVNADHDVRDEQMRTSWMLATIAAWCALLHVDSAYEMLAAGHSKNYPNVGAQLWHPTTDWSKNWYFSADYADGGESEAPFAMPPTADELRQRLAGFQEIERFKWIEHSQTLPAGIWALDFLACRHFRRPVPAVFWGRLAMAQDHLKNGTAETIPV